MYAVFYFDTPYILSSVTPSIENHQPLHNSEQNTKILDTDCETLPNVNQMKCQNQHWVITAHPARLGGTTPLLSPNPAVSHPSPHQGPGTPTWFLSCSFPAHSDLREPNPHPQGLPPSVSLVDTQRLTLTFCQAALKSCPWSPPNSTLGASIPRPVYLHNNAS